MKYLTRKGYIKITDEAYSQHWDKIYPALKDFRPIHISFNHHENVWYLYGISDKFRQIKEGEDTPQYDLVIDNINLLALYSFYKMGEVCYHFEPVD